MRKFHVIFLEMFIETQFRKRTFDLSDMKQAQADIRAFFKEEQVLIMPVGNIHTAEYSTLKTELLEHSEISSVTASLH